ncbi:glycerate kinase type-2 family protein [Pseudopedobacter beijingensis]|uniref:Glycerate kinase n=1 Tax=Pseudopedobacter beijingensis TaxID=1207056 RepID=A0ABW4IHF2_9SPHI
MREKAEDIFRAGIQAVQPQEIMPQWIQKRDNALFVKGEKIDLDTIGHVYLIGAGKAAAAMAQVLEDILGDALTSGIIAVKYGHVLPLKKIKILQAAHPVPDENSVAAVNEILKFAEKTTEKDLVFFLLSGGASSILTDFPDGSNLGEIRELFENLLQCGANINEINCVRKQLSKIKGGGLAKAIYPSRLISFIISDVPNNDISTIGSGLTVPKLYSHDSAKDILKKYQIYDELSENLKRSIDVGKQKTEEAVFTKTVNYIIADNEMAVNAAAGKAEDLGYKVIIQSEVMEGLAVDVAEKITQKANSIKADNPVCFIYGGETTVEVNNKQGIGGRSQHLALAALLNIDKDKQITLLAGGTDGGDGPTNVAGAIIDNSTVENAAQKNVNPKDFLAQNNSCHFFKETGGHINTGPTNTNVMDLVIVLVDNPC